MSASKSRRCFALAVLTAAGWALAGAPTSAANGIAISADAGYDGVTRTGRWTPVRVTIENAGKPLSGELVIEGGRARVVQPMVLPVPSRKVIEQYIRLPSSDIDHVHVSLVVEGRELAGVDAVVRPAPDDGSFLLCVRSAAISAPEAGCTATVIAERLPLSWRGYDVVDQLESPVTIESSLSEEQRLALSAWRIRHAHEQTIPPASESRDVPVGPPQTRLFIAAYAGLFLLMGASSRALGRKPRRLYGAFVTVVGIGCAAAVAQGRVGSGASVVVTGSTVIRAAEGLDGAFVSTQGVAIFPAFALFELRPNLDDGVLMARQASAPIEFADDGESVVSGQFGKGQHVRFDMEGFSKMATLEVRRAATLSISNVTAGDLTDCELPAGLSPRHVSVLHPQQTLTVAGAPDGAAAAITCRLRRASVVRGDRGGVADIGTAVLVYVLASGQAAQ
jgi:hypothetical protein